MRIVHLVDLFAPNIGGTERVVEDLALAQAAAGDAVTVITLTPAGPAEVALPGVTVIRLQLGKLASLGIADTARPFHPPFPLWHVTGELRNVLAGLDADVIIAHSWMVYSYLPLRQELGTPVVWYLHDFLLSCPKRTKLYEHGGPCPGARVRRCISCSSSQYGAVKASVVAIGQHRANSRLLDRVDHLLANSTSVASVGSADVAIAAPLTVVGVPITLRDAKRATRQRPRFLPDGEFILFVGQLSEQKGLYELLEAFTALEAPGVRLVCIGTKQPSTPTHWPEGTIVVENVAHEEVLAALECSRFGVLPSHAEGLGLVALEGAGAGKAMIVTNVGGLTEVVDNGVTGLVVPVRDVASLQAAMQQLLDDPELARTMGVAGRKKAELMTDVAVALRIREVLASLLEGREGRQR